MTRTLSDGHPKVLPACNFLSQYYFYNIFLQKSCRFSLQTLTKFEAAKTGSGVGFLRLTAVCTRSQPRCSVNMSRNAFFSSRSEKNIIFDVDIVVKNKNVKIEIWFIVVCTLIEN